MVALVGDAELDEGNIYEALMEGWKHGLRNTWWVIDYNRQSLDAVAREGLYGQFDKLFRSMGWEVVTIKYGHLLQAAFQEPGGEALRDWIDRCPNQLYSALTFQGGAAWRKRLLDDLGDQGPLTALIEARSDDELARLMTNLGGHDPAGGAGGLRCRRPRPPGLFHRLHGEGLRPAAGRPQGQPCRPDDPRPDGGLPRQPRRSGGTGMGAFRSAGHPPRRGRGLSQAVPFNAKGRRRYQAAVVPVAPLPAPAGAVMSTQEGFGKILNELAREDSPLAQRIVTTSPDVTVSTNLGGWVNRRGLFNRTPLGDTFRDEKVPSAQKWIMSPEGQHIELGIAEMNLFLLLGALGLSHSLFGERLLPIGTLYDPFIQRGLDALNYACYQDARFLLVATPSGITLAPEGGAHQSVGTPLIGLAQDGLAAFEPAFVDELAAIMTWSFDYMQRDGKGEPSGPWLRDENGGSVYLRLSTRPLEQPKRALDAALAQDIINGAYWLRRPGPNCAVVIAYQGAVAAEAIAAAGLIGEDRRDVGVLAVTSSDRLSAGWHAAERARQEGRRDARCHIETLLAPLDRDTGLVTVLDGHPTTLSWLGAVQGHRVQALGVEHFGQTGTVDDLYAHHRIDTAAIVAAANAASAGRPIRYLRAVP